jgi:hypothetical protein
LLPGIPPLRIAAMVVNDAPMNTTSPFFIPRRAGMASYCRCLATRVLNSASRTRRDALKVYTVSAVCPPW